MFEKENTRLLTSFYKARFLNYLTVKLTMSNKVTATKVYAGEKYKKTNVLLLIQLAFDVRTLPVIGKVPDLPPVEIPRIMVKPLTVLLFESNSDNVITDFFSIHG